MNIVCGPTEFVDVSIWLDFHLHEQFFFSIIILRFELIAVEERYLSPDNI